jgi:tetratricopeptide (TPR) repeat protein
MAIDEAAAARLGRLEHYLLQDPNNVPLLEDAYSAAFDAGEWDRARFHLRHAVALGASGNIWVFRESRLDMATRQWADARGRLEALLAAPDLAPDARDAVIHDLAFVAFREGDFVRAREILAPMLEPVDASPAPAAMQMLWLRTLHHAGDLEGAIDWARSRLASGALTPEGAGVASLAAIDLGHLELAQGWADTALKANGELLEALVSRGTIALARFESDKARATLARALMIHPEDGRTWSALGFVDLLEQKLPKAAYDFHQAIRFMPEHVGTWNGLGWTSILERQFTAAASAFERAIELDRNFGESHGGLAVAYANLGRKEEAEDAIARATGLDKTSLAAQYAKAILSGEVRDAQSIQRLAARLLGRRAAPAGGVIADWLPPGIIATAPADTDATPDPS